MSANKNNLTVLEADAKIEFLITQNKILGGRLQSERTEINNLRYKMQKAKEALDAVECSNDYIREALERAEATINKEKSQRMQITKVAELRRRQSLTAGQEWKDKYTALFVDVHHRRVFTDGYGGCLGCMTQSKWNSLQYCVICVEKYCCSCMHSLQMAGFGGMSCSANVCESCFEVNDNMNMPLDIFGIILSYHMNSNQHQLLLDSQ